MRKGALVTGLVLLIVVLALAQYGVLGGREGFAEKVFNYLSILGFLTGGVFGIMGLYGLINRIKDYLDPFGTLSIIDLIINIVFSAVGGYIIYFSYENIYWNPYGN